MKPSSKHVWELYDSLLQTFASFLLGRAKQTETARASHQQLSVAQAVTQALAASLPFKAAGVYIDYVAVSLGLGCPDFLGRWPLDSGVICSNRMRFHSRLFGVRKITIHMLIL